MNIPTIGGARGIFEIFVPGVFLLLHLVLFLYLLPFADDPIQSNLLTVISSPVLGLVIVVVFGYLIGVLLRLSRADLPDRWSSRWLRCGIWLRPRLKSWLRLRRFNQEEHRNYRRLLYSYEEFPYIRWLGVICRRSLPPEVSEFYSRIWAKRRIRGQNRTFFNFCKVMLNSIDEKATNEIYAAEALTRYVAEMFYALTLASLLILITLILQYVYRGKLFVALVILLVMYLFALRGILKHFRFIRIKEVETVFVASFRNKSMFDSNSAKRIPDETK